MSAWSVKRCGEERLSRKFSSLPKAASRDEGAALLPSRQSLGEDIYEALLTQLISLKIPPGERLSIDALVRDFGVSQTPIRSALIRLEAEGLVVSRHNVGYSAAPIPSGERFRDIYDFRLLLEPAAAAAATERITPGQRQALADISLEMETTMREETAATYGRFAVLDARFHEMIAEAGGNKLIVESLGRLYTHMHLFRLRYHATVTGEAIKEHVCIVAAMEAGDAPAAAEAMRSHIVASRERLEPYYRFIK